MLQHLVKDYDLQSSHGKDLVIMCNFEINVKDKQECLLFISIKLPLRTLFNFNHCGDF